MRKTLSICSLAFATIQAVPTFAADFLFIRHAESTANAGTATTVQEFLDPPLTVLGQQQALNLENVLASYDITTLYTSAYQRTQLTIAPTAAAFGLTPTVDARTNEWYIGDVASIAELGSVNPLGVIGAWAAGNTAAKANLPNAESLDDLVARVIPAWNEIVNQHKDEDGIVVLVGHGAEIGFVMPYFAENVSLDFAFSHGLQNTGIVQLEVINDQPYVTNWQGTPLPVPEPETYAMLMAGLGLMGLMARRKKQAS